MNASETRIDRPDTPIITGMQKVHAPSADTVHAGDVLASEVAALRSLLNSIEGWSVGRGDLRVTAAIALRIASTSSRIRQTFIRAQLKNLPRRPTIAR